MKVRPENKEEAPHSLFSQLKRLRLYPQEQELCKPRRWMEAEGFTLS